MRMKGNDIIKEVKVYVPSTASTCDLSGGFRLRTPIFRSFVRIVAVAVAGSVF
jgi:hypothetical protein